MDQREIFRLLLLILLLTNNCNDDGGGFCGIGNINQILIILLLLNPPRFDNDEGRFEDRFEDRDTTF